MITVHDLTQSFRVDKHRLTVFENINFEIARNEWVALTGSSGSGKTSLLHLLAGLARPQSGQIYYNDFELCRASSGKLSKWRREHIGFIFQAFNLFPELSALENVLLPGIIKGQVSAKSRSRAADLLAMVGLSARAEHRPAELSGGEQQRIAIARALLNEPETLFADEPTGNLDDENTEVILNILRKLHQEMGMTIIMVTHQHQVADQAQRVLHLANQGITC